MDFEVYSLSTKFLYNFQIRSIARYHYENACLIFSRNDAIQKAITFLSCCSLSPFGKLDLQMCQFE